MDGWDSKRIIGNVKEMFQHFEDRERERGVEVGSRKHGDIVWRAFYNGWLEGRGDMLMQMEKDCRR